MSYGREESVPEKVDTRPLTKSLSVGKACVKGKSVMWSGVEEGGV
jgi:hypothetical protein